MSIESNLQTYEASGAAGFVESFVGLLSRSLSGLAREWRIRRDHCRLVEFDDAMLRDIGVARSEIESALRHGRHARARSLPGVS